MVLYFISCSRNKIYTWSWIVVTNFSLLIAASRALGTFHFSIYLGTRLWYTPICLKLIGLRYYELKIWFSVQIKKIEELSLMHGIHLLTECSLIIMTYFLISSFFFSSSEGEEQTWQLHVNSHFLNRSCKYILVT